MGVDTGNIYSKFPLVLFEMTVPASVEILLSPSISEKRLMSVEADECWGLMSVGEV